MRITHIMAATGMAVLLAACATNDNTVSVNQQVAANSRAAPGSPDEMICRNERVTGQLIPRRVCMTRAEREALERDADEMFEEESIRHLRINPDGRGG